jgi:hypothetical protein
MFLYFNITYSIIGIYKFESGESVRLFLWVIILNLMNSSCSTNNELIKNNSLNVLEEKSIIKDKEFIGVLKSNKKLSKREKFVKSLQEDRNYLLNKILVENKIKILVQENSEERNSLQLKRFDFLLKAPWYRTELIAEINYKASYPAHFGKITNWKSYYLWKVEGYLIVFDNLFKVIKRFDIERDGSYLGATDDYLIFLKKEKLIFRNSSMVELANSYPIDDIAESLKEFVHFKNTIFFRHTNLVRDVDGDLRFLNSKVYKYKILSSGKVKKSEEDVDFGVRYTWAGLKSHWIDKSLRLWVSLGKVGDLRTGKYLTVVEVRKLGDIGNRYEVFADSLRDHRIFKKLSKEDDSYFIYKNITLNNRRITDSFIGKINISEYEVNIRKEKDIPHLHSPYMTFINNKVIDFSRNLNFDCYFTVWDLEKNKWLFQDRYYELENFKEKPLVTKANQCTGRKFFILKLNS